MDLSDIEEDTNAEFSINKSFAQKYEERKKAEEISFLKDRYGDRYDEEDDASDSESDEEEDENGELLTKELDLQILKTIGIIRSKKPEIYDPKKVFFSEDTLKQSEESWKEKQEGKKAQGKKVTLKDYHRQRLLDGGDMDEETQDVEDDSQPITKSYLEEQEELKKSFKLAIGDDDEDDDELFPKADSNDDEGLFTVRQKSKAEIDQEEADYKTFMLENIKKDGVLEEWTEENAAVDPSEKFLMDFILNKQWVDEDADENAIPTYEQIVRDEHIDEDEAGEDEADRFEHAYNFRFEEADGANIETFSRIIEDTMRRKSTTRADKRAALKARKAEEKKAKEEELKRLKNLKKEELRIKLQKIADVAGTDASAFKEVDLDEEFDPSKFDQMMADRFNEEYYETYEENGALMKPEFDDGLDLDDDKYAEYDDDIDNGPPPIAGLIDEQEEEDIIMDADYLPGGEYYGEEEQPTGKKNKKKELKEKKKAAKEESAAAQSLDQYLDEYLALDHEDMIGDLATRFKYRKVEPEDYGLTAVEILMAPDNALNDYVPLKHIAPFRPEQRKKRDKEIWSKTKKKKMKKLRDSLEAAKVGKTLEEWENDKREKKKKAEMEEKRLGQAAKKAMKRAKKAAGGEGGEGNVEANEDEEGVASVVETQGKAEKKPAVAAATKPKEKKEGGKKKAVKLSGATSMKGGVTSERLASYGIPSHKK
ncbi:KRI1-like family C-terminal-domain-containing protein [Obelidium mucronatum]|nr:KRI1-like family C-terminal-domain-containing protein [Obelidium mucronatum]